MSAACRSLQGGDPFASRSAGGRAGTCAIAGNVNVPCGLRLSRSAMGGMTNAAPRKVPHLPAHPWTGVKTTTPRGSKPDPMSREVDRLLAQLADAGSGRSREPDHHERPQASRPTFRSRVRSSPRAKADQERYDRIGLWARVFLASALGVVITQWPYAHSLWLAAHRLPGGDYHGPAGGRMDRRRLLEPARGRGPRPLVHSCVLGNRARRRAAAAADRLRRVDLYVAVRSRAVAAVHGQVSLVDFERPDPVRDPVPDGVAPAACRARSPECAQAPLRSEQSC